jgi:hypothetical protein
MSSIDLLDQKLQDIENKYILNPIFQVKSGNIDKCRDKKYKIIMSHGSLLPRSYKEDREINMNNIEYLDEQLKNPHLDKDKLINMKIEYIKKKEHSERLIKLIPNETFILPEDTNVIYLSKAGEPINFSSFDNLLASFYQDGNTIFENEDKSKIKTREFLNHKEFKSLLSEDKLRKDIDGSIYAKNHLSGEIINNLILSFDGTFCDGPSGSHLCNISCTNGASESSNRNEVKGKIYLQDLINKYGAGSYIIIACRSCEVPEMVSLARSISDGNHDPITASGSDSGSGSGSAPASGSGSVSDPDAVLGSSADSEHLIALHYARLRRMSQNIPKEEREDSFKQVRLNIIINSKIVTKIASNLFDNDIIIKAIQESENLERETRLLLLRASNLITLDEKYILHLPKHYGDLAHASKYFTDASKNFIVAINIYKQALELKEKGFNHPLNYKNLNPKSNSTPKQIEIFRNMKDKVLVLEEKINDLFELAENIFKNANNNDKNDEIFNKGKRNTPIIIRY